MIQGFIRWMKIKRNNWLEERRKRAIFDRISKIDKELRRLQFRFEYLVQNPSEARNTDAINRQMSDLQYSKKLLTIDFNRRT
jgi:hypothetical protein